MSDSILSWIPKDNLPASVVFLCPYCDGKAYFHHGSSSKAHRLNGIVKICPYRFCPWCGEKVNPYSSRYAIGGWVDEDVVRQAFEDKRG